MDDGIKSWGTQYKNNEKNGVAIDYNYEGKLHTKTQYKNGKKDGIEIVYSDTSNYKCRETNWKNGKKRRS